MWGYIWNHADVKVTYARNTDKVAIKDCGIYMNNATSKNNIFGGLLYQYQNAYMDLTEGFTIDGLTLSAPNSTRDNCAFIVSYSQTSMIFLKDYKLINAKVIFAGKMFDEISGKTKDNNELNAAQSNMGIISLADSQTPYSIKKEDYHTYAYQGDYSECPNMQKPYYNAYTRYYYNLDDVVKKVEEDPIESFKININGVDYQTLNIKTPEQLMIWHLVSSVYYSSSSSTGANAYMAKYFANCFTGIANPSNTYAVRSMSLMINGTIDLTGISYYPTYISSNQVIVGAHYNTVHAAEGIDKIIFDYDNIRQASEEKFNAGENCIPLRSSCVVENYYASSQHYRIHTGMFTNNSYIAGVNGIAFGGSIGTFKYNATTEYSGALFTGLLSNTNKEVTYKNIVFDGLYVVNPDEDYVSGKNTGSLDSWKNYYGLLMGGWTGTSVISNFDTIIMKGYGDFVSNYPNKKAATALIGVVGGADNITGLKKFEFKNMSIADAEETTVLSDNGTTLEGIHATKEDQVMAFASYIYKYLYATAEQGYYNFDDVDYFYGNGQFNPESGDEYYITLGKELGNSSGVTVTEYYNTSSKVGTESNDTVKAEDNIDYINFTPASADNYWLDFSNLNYKPYVYNYETRNINVNYKSGDLNVGCGTYEDPYIISNERQLYSLYCYLAAGGVRRTGSSDVAENGGYANYSDYYTQYNNGFKTKLNEWKVNVPGRDDTFCDGTHTTLTYDYETHPITGFDDTVEKEGKKRTRATNARISVNLLRNAYYKITSDIDMSEYEDFYGICHFDPKIDSGINASGRFPFTGVIIGEKSDGSAPVIKMPTFKKFTGSHSDFLNYLRGYGFISSAKGCVVKNLQISYPDEGCAKIGDNNNPSNGDYVFGGVIGTIWGGDNIIDDVKVSGSVKINRTSAYSLSREYIGGLVGAVRSGGLIFRNLSTDDFADFDLRQSINTTQVSPTIAPGATLPPRYTESLSNSKYRYTFINGTVGRVTNGYVLVESVDEPEKSEDNDGDKLYKLDDSGPIIDFSEYDANTSNKLYASQTFDFINGKYLEDADRIDIRRTGYDFQCNINNAKQLEIFATTLSTGGFFTSCSGSYPSYIFDTSNDLSHVYTCSTSMLATNSNANGTYPAAYDVYSRCRKAKYDSVGNCEDSSNEDYNFAKKYDNINTSEFFETNYRNFNSNSYRNYIGYNYMLNKYFKFYNNGVEDDFWIIRESGRNYNSTTYYNTEYYNMCTIFNAYGEHMNRPNYTKTTVELKENEEYDMTPYKGAFRGIGYAVIDDYGGVKEQSGGTFNGNFHGNGATIKLDMRAEANIRYAALFPYINAGNGARSFNGSVGNQKELVPMRTIKDLKLSGTVEGIRSSYNSDSGTYSSMLCSYLTNGRYNIENIEITNANIGAYSNSAALVGVCESTAQLITNNCNAENIRITNKPNGAETTTNTSMGGLYGYINPYSESYNTSYFSNGSVKNVTFDMYNSSSAGGYAGELRSGGLSIFDTKTENITFNNKETASSYTLYCGGFMGKCTSGSAGLNIVNADISDIKMNSPIVNSTSRFGGFAEKVENSTNVNLENVSINNVRYRIGASTATTYYYSSNGGYLGGMLAELTNAAVSVDGIYIDDVKAEESELTVTKATQNASGKYTSINVTSTQRLQYAGGLIGYYNITSSYTDRGLRIKTLSEDNITATPTPKPTGAPHYDGSDKFIRPEPAENSNKNSRSYIKNSELFARYSGGVIGYMYYYPGISYNSKTGINSTAANTEMLVEDLDIEENKIISFYPYRTSCNGLASNTSTSFFGDTSYEGSAAGIISYVSKSQQSNAYFNNINLDHNVIGTIGNYTAYTVSGGAYGKVTEGESTANNAGYGHYLYNTTLKNNYIGPLDLIKDEGQYYIYPNNSSVSGIDSSYRLFTAQHSAFNQLRELSVDELGSYTRLYEDGNMNSSDSWNYSVTQPYSGEWYAQDNLYRYTKRVGTFIGYDSQNTKDPGKRFHTFFVAPKIVYDDTEYEYKDAEGNVIATSKANAHRPATDVGSKDVLTADDDMYDYRMYVHTIYDDANNPVAYGEWDESIADYVVPQALSYEDNHDYLFAQLKNIYSDYKKQIEPSYLNNAKYDEATHTYRLKDNYAQSEDGYTMDEVYDYIYYGYERNANGEAISDEAKYLSPYTDNDGKVIPMLVYKAQYGTPDVLINTIINILTNNGGQYNSNTGYFNQGLPAILNVESWKMELKNGQAVPVYNADGTHKQGGFSVSYEDVDPQPVPSPTTAPRPYTRKFSLEHTSYDSMKDEKNGTFTVLHVTYGWDNTNLKVAGNNTTSQSVMTLDIPVYVSKLLEVQINMRTLDGVQLSEKNMFNHASTAGAVVLKSANTVMAEYVYDYPRTMYDSVYLKKKLTFETSPGYVYLHKNTKLTLIDITDHDKEYYYYVQRTMANPEIKFEDFVDANGNNYKTRDLSNVENYPKLGTETNPYTDLRGQTWGGSPEDEGYIGNEGIGVEKFLIIIDKSATEIDASDPTAYTFHSVHVRVDPDGTDEALMSRIRYDGKDYKNTPLNTPTEEYPNPDWYAGEVNGYKAYNYVTIREFDDVKVEITSGNVDTFDGEEGENIGIGPGKVMKTTIDYSLTASTSYWNESDKASTDQYLDFVISVQSDNKYVSLPVGTKYSLDGVTWYTIGRDADYEYGKKQIYFYADRAARDIENGGTGEDYKLLINSLKGNTSGEFDVYFDFRNCNDSSFSDGNYLVKVDAYKTTRREYPVSGDFQDSWSSDIYSVYNSGNIGFALQEDNLLYRGINRYLPKVSDNGKIDFKVQLDFRKYLDEETGKIKDVVTNQYYNIGFKIYKKDSSGNYSEYVDTAGRFKFYYDKPKYNESLGKYVFDGAVDDNDPIMWGYDSSSDKTCRGVTYKFTEEQINSDSSIEGVTELVFRLVYDTNELQSDDFSNYRFEAYLCLNENPVSEQELQNGGSVILNQDEFQNAMDMMAEPLMDYLIFTVARLKTD